MKREDIIRMAREAGLVKVEDCCGIPNKFCASDEWKGNLAVFAALVASAEREACIVDIQWHIPRAGRHTPEYQMAMRMLERIKARGQA